MAVIILEVQLIWNSDWNNIREDKERTIPESYLPVKLVYYEKFDRIDEAFYREKQIQGWGRKRKKHLSKRGTMTYINWQNARIEVIIFIG